MLYLIDSEALPNIVAGSPESRMSVTQYTILPSFRKLAEAERSQKITGGVHAGRRRFTLVSDFPSHEEASQWAMSLPFWNMQSTSIAPLVSFGAQLNLINQMMESLKRPSLA